MKELAIQINKEEACRLGIKASASVTCNKPSGTTSSIVDSSAGIHKRFSKYYIRRVRFAKHDPMLEKLQSEGIPNYDAPENPSEQAYIELPIQSPSCSLLMDESSAISQLEN